VKLLAAGNSVLLTGKILTLLNYLVNKVEELVSNLSDGISKYDVVCVVHIQGENDIVVFKGCVRIELPGHDLLGGRVLVFGLAEATEELIKGIY